MDEPYQDSFEKRNGKEASLALMGNMCMLLMSNGVTGQPLLKQPIFNNPESIDLFQNYFRTYTEENAPPTEAHRKMREAVIAVPAEMDLAHPAE